MADIEPFQTSNNSDINSMTNANYNDKYSDRMKNKFMQPNHDKIIDNDQANQYMANRERKTRKLSFSSLDGDPLPMTIQTLLQDLGDQAMELPTRLIFDENILNDDEISRNLSNWAMT